MSTIQFGIRLDKKEKQELDENAKQIGLTAATAVKMLISQFNHDKGFSYSVNRKETDTSDTNLPPEVEKARVLAKAEELGLVKDSSIKVDNLDDWKKRWTEN